MLSHRIFEDTSFGEILGIGIPEFLLNIFSCYGFIQDEKLTLILTYRSKLVSYYLPKGFAIIQQASQALNNVPLRVKNCIHDINMFDIDYIMSFGTSITSVANTLKKIYLVGAILDKSTSEYYNDRNATFGLLFQQYTDSAV